MEEYYVCEFSILTSSPIPSLLMENFRARSRRLRHTAWPSQILEGPVGDQYMIFQLAALSDVRCSSIAGENSDSKNTYPTKFRYSARFIVKRKRDVLDQDSFKMSFPQNMIFQLSFIDSFFAFVMHLTPSDFVCLDPMSPRAQPLWGQAEFLKHLSLTLFMR